MPNNKNCQVTANNLQSNALINVLWGHVCFCFFIFLSFLVTFTIRHLPSSCIYYSFHLSGLLMRWKISCPTYLYRNSFEIELDFYYPQVSFWACWDMKSFHDTVVCIWCSRRVSLFFCQQPMWDYWQVTAHTWAGLSWGHHGDCQHPRPPLTASPLLPSSRVTSSSAPGCADSLSLLSWRHRSVSES